MKTVEEMAVALEERVTRHDIDRSEADELRTSWANDERWKDIVRPYSAEDVLRFRGTVKIDHTFAEMGAERNDHTVARVPKQRAAPGHEQKDGKQHDQGASHAPAGEEVSHSDMSSLAIAAAGAMIRSSIAATRLSASLYR